MRSQQSFMSFVNNKDSALARKDIDRLCCAKCRFSTKDTELFERHVSHHEEVTFSCALCSHVSYSKTESQKHIVSHTGSYPYRCSFCSYGAVRRDYLVKHILRIHKKNAEEGFKTDVALSSQDYGHPSVSEALCMSGWLKRSEPCAVPSSQVELPSGSQPRANKSSVIAKPMSQTSSPCARVTSTACVSNATVKTPFSSSAPSCSTSSSHSLSNTPHVVLRSREESVTLLNSLLNANVQNKVAYRRTESEKPIPNGAFPRVCGSSAEPLPQNPRVGVPEKPVYTKTLPRVQVRPPAEMNTPLRPLLNMALSKRTAGANAAMQKTTSTVVRAPLHSSAEKRTNSRILVGSSTETSNPLSNVQVELLAPLNQPIQHNKPLTVSCPEEINIPAGCLVELVEVKNVNGTRELELRMIPPNGVPQGQRITVNGPSQDPTGSRQSFKCQVAAKECPVGPSTSYQVKQQQPSATAGTKMIHLTHKPQRPSEAVARNKLYLKARDPGIKRTSAGVSPELSSEGLPVISSVFSLCPTPTENQSGSLSFPETQRWTVASKEPKDNKRRGDRSLVCSILIKKEEETEEKPKVASLNLQETRTEPESTKAAKVPKGRPRVKRTAVRTLNPNVKASRRSNKDAIPQGKDRESRRNSEGDSFMYPKVALVRIPNSLLEPAEKLPEAPPQEESLTARPVLCCALGERNVSGGPEVAIKLILKRDFRQTEERLPDQEPPPRKRHKKEKRKEKKRRLSSGLTQALRLTPLKAHQLVKLPGPNQPVVVLNHPNPSIRTASVGAQTLRNYKWICSMDQTERKQPSLKMKLKKVHGQKYQVIELLLNGVSEKQLT